MGRGRGGFVACATVRLRNSAETLVPGPPVYQDLSTRNDWPVKNAIVDLPIRMKGNSKHTSGNSLRDPEQRSRRCFADVTNQGYNTPATPAGVGGGGGGGDIVASP